MLTPETLIMSDNLNGMMSQETASTQSSWSIGSSFIFDSDEVKSSFQGNKRKIPVFNSWQKRDADKLT